MLFRTVGEISSVRGLANEAVDGRNVSSAFSSVGTDCSGFGVVGAVWAWHFSKARLDWPEPGGAV